MWSRCRVFHFIFLVMGLPAPPEISVFSETDNRVLQQRLNLLAGLSARIYSIFLSQQNSFSRLISWL